MQSSWVEVLELASGSVAVRTRGMLVVEAVSVKSSTMNLGLGDLDSEC